MIKTVDLCKMFMSDGVETSALQNINLAIEEGDFTAIMGPPKSGKSTLLRILGLLDNPSSGQIFLKGEDVAEMSNRIREKNRRHKIGFVFENFNLIDELSVFENIELPLLYRKNIIRQQNKKVVEVMDKINISNLSKQFPQQLTGIQKQQVAICRAVVEFPMLILADEPTGELDSTGSLEIMDLLNSLNSEGITIVIATRSFSDANQAKRIIRLLDGQVLV